MKTTTRSHLINARVQYGKRSKLCKVIKQYIYTNNMHHLIGVIYYNPLTNIQIDSKCIINEFHGCQTKIKLNENSSRVSKGSR